VGKYSQRTALNCNKWGNITVIALIQRVTEAAVTVDAGLVGSIGRGIVALVAVQPGDTRAVADRLLERIVGYRIFDDEEGRMNLSLGDVHGELLLVSQFTLAADTRKGMRAGFSTAADPETGRELFEYLVSKARTTDTLVATGRFGGRMRVSLINDGPVTFWLQVSPASEAG
jgi:D-aminoacyl-tRNA deacylase